MTGVKEDENTFVSRTIDDNGFNPEWDETFTFEVSRPDIAVLLFTVWDKDVTSRDDFIGQVHFLDRCHSQPLLHHSHALNLPARHAQTAVRLDSLRQGFRTVNLNHANGK